MVEWNGIFRLFRFSGILGQMSVPFAPPTGISGIFGRMESAPDVVAGISARFSKFDFVLSCYITNHLMIGPLGNSEFCFLESFMFSSTSKFTVPLGTGH